MNSKPASENPLEPERERIIRKDYRWGVHPIRKYFRLVDTPRKVRADLLEMPPSDKVILLVDDSADDVFLFKRMLARTHLRNPVQAVAKVEEAICYLEGSGIYADRAVFPVPSIAIIDLHAPNKDGFYLLEWIRGRSALRDLHVIVVSGVNRLQDVNRAYQMGAHSFLTKPIKEEDILNLARAYPAARS